MRRPGQIPLFLCCALAAGFATLAFDPVSATRFSSYGAGLPTATMVAICIVLGVPALWLIDRSGFFVKSHRRPVARLMAPALLFALITIAIDRAHPFPAGINARFPQSLLFYPAIAVVAETVFHLVPLALVLVLTRRAAVAIFAAALVEPAFQLSAGWSGPMHWSDALIGLNILGISLAQLIGFRRHGFAAMIGFRLTYYLCWHILWGEARLWWLLPATGG